MGSRDAAPHSISPPAWAVALLRLLLPRSRAADVSGDLIEEYRETVYPSRGRRRADLWLAGQVGGFIWRIAGVWGLLFAALMSGRLVFDMVSPPQPWASSAAWWPRSAVTTWSAVAVFVLAGAWGASRTGRARTGVLVAISAHAIASVLDHAFVVIFFFTVIRRDHEMLNLFNATGGWGEVWGIPLMILPIVAALGSLGGLIGKPLGPAARPAT